MENILPRRFAVFRDGGIQTPSRRGKMLLVSPDGDPPDNETADDEFNVGELNSELRLPPLCAAAFVVIGLPPPIGEETRPNAQQVLDPEDGTGS